MKTFLLATALLSGAAQAQPAALSGAAADWPTWGYDQERTAWNRGEKSLSKANVGKLRVKWKAQLPVPVVDVVLSTVSAPIVVAGVTTAQGPRDMVFILGANDQLFALDANTGAIVWSKELPNPVKATKIATWLCSNTNNATPTADKTRGLIYALPSDGKLRALSLADGSERMAPTEMVAPFARAWSLNLINDVIYTPSGRACGELTDANSPMVAARFLDEPYSNNPRPTDPSSITAIDVRDLAKPEVTRFYLSGGRPAAPWGRGGVVRGPQDSVLFETSDGLFDPAAGNWADTLLALAPKATRVVDSFTPENHRYIASKDLGGSASPVVFRFGDRMIVAYGQKEGVLRLLDARNLGGKLANKHQKPLWESPQLANDIAAGTDPSQGIWGAITTYLTPGGKRFLYVPIWGPASVKAPAFPVSGGPAPHGMIMAFEVVEKDGVISAEPRWTSGDMIMVDPPSVANGVLYVTSTGGQASQNPRKPDGTRVANTTPESIENRSTPVDNLKLYAFDAETGKQLYSSKQTIPDWVHFGEPVVALGKVFLTTHDGHVYAFGL